MRNEERGMRRPGLVSSFSSLASSRRDVSAQMGAESARGWQPAAARWARQLALPKRAESGVRSPGRARSTRARSRGVALPNATVLMVLCVISGVPLCWWLAAVRARCLPARPAWPCSNRASRRARALRSAERSTPFAPHRISGASGSACAARPPGRLPAAPAVHTPSTFAEMSVQPVNNTGYPCVNATQFA